MVNSSPKIDTAQPCSTTVAAQPDSKLAVTTDAVPSDAVSPAAVPNTDSNNVEALSTDNTAIVTKTIGSVDQPQAGPSKERTPAIPAVQTQQQPEPLPEPRQPRFNLYAFRVVEYLSDTDDEEEEDRAFILREMRERKARKSRMKG